MQPRFDPERQIEEARAALVAHLSELRHRLAVARARVDLPAKIAAHPLASVGAAFALGALLGMRGGGRRRVGRVGEAGEAGEHRVARLVFATLGALAVRLGKELALREATEAAHGWWERRQAASSEDRTSHERGGESLLRH
jgi:hypothetical protein